MILPALIKLKLRLLVRTLARRESTAAAVAYALTGLVLGPCGSRSDEGPPSSCVHMVRRACPS